ncbi:OLC1v1017040C1 [Oldenlandia corymbosa var. corymbosa]|uniref:OLC1v1017040C1 n=1 Tax=Oldenlandia corymbosa var. corymbosa TaxID=529605 RepID=A0AAV1E8J6_OLDCO|nr:OLC1v1017040C1 [Oldenlandia corymbosa var. corymbosa]
MKMTQVNMCSVPLETRSIQPINVPEYSEDDLEEEDEDEENEFDQDDVQDSVRMGAYHRDRLMYNVSSYPPPLFGCPRPRPGGLPSPPTPIPSPMSGQWRSPHCSPSFPRVVQFPQVTDEVPGGPKDGSVIPNFLWHIAYHFWHGYHRPILKIFKGEKILNKLKLWYRDMDDVVKGKIGGTGLGHLLHTSYDDIDLGLEKLVSGAPEIDVLRGHAAGILGLDSNGYKWSHGGVSDWFILERCQKADENTQASAFLWVLLASTLFMGKSGGRCSVSLVNELMAGLKIWVHTCKDLLRLRSYTVS